jgi:rhodanese-related sulfurtransferase
MMEEELERQRKERWEREERQLEAKRQASKILYIEPDEIFFTIREYEGRPETYLTLGKKVPYEVYKALISSGSLVKEKDPEDGNIYYIIKDEQKAAQVLAKHGFKAILSKEWQQRLEKAAQILRNAGVDPSYLYLRF